MHQIAMLCSTYAYAVLVLPDEKGTRRVHCGRKHLSKIEADLIAGHVQAIELIFGLLRGPQLRLQILYHL